MNSVKIILSESSTESSIPYSVIQKLIEFAKGGVSMQLLGRIELTSSLHESEYNYMAAHYPNLHITIPQGRQLYIDFEDSTVESLISGLFGDGTGVTPQEAQSVTTFGNLFYRKGSIRKFSELNRFTNVTQNLNFYLSSIQEINLANITKINQSSFLECYSLTNVGNTANVTTIEYRSFYRCQNLSNFDFTSVKRIDYDAFYGCRNLKIDLLLPNYTSSFIGYCAFLGSGIKSIVLPSCINLLCYNNGGYASLGGCFESCTSLTKADLSNTCITNNGGNKCLFRGCGSLSIVKLPSSITAINLDDYNGCSSLRTMICNAASPPTIGTNAFSNVPTTMKVYVPDASVSTYEQASGWSTYTILPISQYVEE